MKNNYRRKRKQAEGNKESTLHVTNENNNFEKQKTLKKVHLSNKEVPLT